MSNKIKAKAYHTAVSEYDEVTVKNMVDQGYIQHNLKVPTGRAAFLSMLPKLKEHGSKIENIRMLEDGSHIIMHHKWVHATPFGFDQTAAFHIIRFDSEGLIAEHWNVMTELTPPNAFGRSLLDGATEIKDVDKTENNKSTIKELFNILVNQSSVHIIDAIPIYFKPNFHQHDRFLGDGILGLVEAIPDKSIFPDYQKQHKVFGEGNFVLSISEGLLAGENTALYDLFQLENGKIVEHWSINQVIPTENLANDNTMFNF